MLPTIGLALIIIGWLEQIYRTMIRRHLSFSPFFLTAYLIGAGIVAFGDISTGDIVNGVLNAITVILAFVILVNLIYKRKKPGAF